MFKIALVFTIILAIISPAAADASGYQRFCTLSNNTKPGSYIELGEKLKAQQNASEIPNTILEESSKTYLHLPSRPTLIVRHVEHLLGIPVADRETILLADLKSSTKKWWLAHIDSRGTFLDANPAISKDRQNILGLGRSMAAYVLVNDLLADDTTIPRSGCAKLFDVWFHDFPGLLPIMKLAIAKGPPSDPALKKRVRTAWKTLISSEKKGAEATLTRETARIIGSNPEVISVYHDPGLPGDGIGPIDVVRIGKHPRTYSMTTGFGRIALSSTYCVVGDTRCAQFYSWP